MLQYDLEDTSTGFNVEKHNAVIVCRPRGLRPAS